MNNQTLITVRSVRESSDWYCEHLGLQKGHGGNHYEQLIYDNKLVLQLHCLDSDINHEALLRSDDSVGLGVLLWFSVVDFDVALDILIKLKTVFDKKPFFNQYANQWEVWFSDLYGYRIVLSGPSEYDIKPLECNWR